MNSKSQMGQDKILDQQIFNGKKNGVFVEVGALDGICGSNTYFFEKERSWTGLLIEPNPIEFKKLEKIDRELSIKENCAISNEEGDINFLSIEGPCNVLSGILEFYNENHLSRINRELESYKSYEEGHELYSKSETIKMKALKLQTLFDKYNLVDIDLISIDVEGAELDVLKGATRILQECRPFVLFEFGLGSAEYYEASPEAMFGLMQENRMAIFALKDWFGHHRPLDSQEFTDHFNHNSEYYFLAVPAEKI